MPATRRITPTAFRSVRGGEAAGEPRADEGAGHRAERADPSSVQSMPPGQMADEPGRADCDADDEVRPDRAGRLLADPADERRQPQRSRGSARSGRRAHRSRGRSTTAARTSGRVPAAPGDRRGARTKQVDAEGRASAAPITIRSAFAGIAERRAAGDRARRPRAAASRRRGASRPGRRGYGVDGSRRRPRCPETAMFAPPAAAGVVPARSRTGSRMLPRTRPSEPSGEGHEEAPDTDGPRMSACTGLNIAHERANAASERVGAAGSGGGAARAEGSAHRPRDDHRRRDEPRPAPRDRVRERARHGAQADGDARRARGGARAAAEAARAPAPDEADSTVDVRVRSLGRAWRADDPADRRARPRR